MRFTKQQVQESVEKALRLQSDQFKNAANPLPIIACSVIIGFSLGWLGCFLGMVIGR